MPFVVRYTRMADRNELVRSHCWKEATRLVCDEGRIITVRRCRGYPYGYRDSTGEASEGPRYTAGPSAVNRYIHDSRITRRTPREARANVGVGRLNFPSLYRERCSSGRRSAEDFISSLRSILPMLQISRAAQPARDDKNF